MKASDIPMTNKLSYPEKKLENYIRKCIIHIPIVYPIITQFLFSD